MWLPYKDFSLTGGVGDVGDLVLGGEGNWRIGDKGGEEWEAGDDAERTK